MFCSGVKNLRSLDIHGCASMHSANDQLRNPVVAGATNFRTTKITSEDLL